MKRGVFIAILLIIFSSSVYAPQISWPGDVPYEESFHEILYTDQIEDAYGDDIIDVNANFDFNSTFCIMNALSCGDFSVDNNLTVGDTIFSKKSYHTENIGAAFFCNEDGTLCNSFEDLQSAIAESYGSPEYHAPTLSEILSSNPDASDYTGTTSFGGLMEFFNNLNVKNGAAIFIEKSGEPEKSLQLSVGSYGELKTNGIPLAIGYDSGQEIYIGTGSPTADVTFGNDIELADSKKAKFGSSGASIYAVGNELIIDIG